jgi:hypothetical protein
MVSTEMAMTVASEMPAATMSEAMVTTAMSTTAMSATMTPAAMAAASVAAAFADRHARKQGRQNKDHNSDCRSEHGRLRWQAPLRRR